MAKSDKSSRERHEASDGGTVKGIARGMGATEKTVRELAKVRENASRLSRDDRAYLTGQLPTH